MALKVTNLTKEYVRQNHTFQAVNKVNLVVEPGDFISIIGRSGSGKSTLLNIIAGLLKPTSGTVEIDGKDISKMNDKEASKYRNKKIGYVSQGQSALASLTVLDNICLPHDLYNKSEDVQELALSLLQETGISHLASSYPKQLSGGELKRIAIARALINHPDYIIADEPTSDLDTQTTKEIMELLKKVSSKNTAVIMVTHELDVLGYGNRTYIMDSGKLTEK